MVRLFIEGQEVELSDKQVALTFQINYIGELKDRQSDFSNQFEILKTNANNIILGFSDLSDGSNMPYEKLDAVLMIGDTELRGFIIIEEGGLIAYNCTFYKGNLLFFDEIEDKPLRSLDLSSLDHDWSFGNVVNSHDETTGYIYPIIDWGYNDTVMNNSTAEVNPKYMHPCVYFKTIWDKIFTEHGLAYNGDIFSDDIFTKTVVSLQINPDQTAAEKAKVYYGDTIQNESDIIAAGDTNELVFNERFKDDYSLGQLYNFKIAPLLYSNLWAYRVMFNGNYKINLKSGVTCYFANTVTLRMYKTTGLDFSTASIIAQDSYTFVPIPGVISQMSANLSAEADEALLKGEYVTCVISSSITESFMKGAYFNVYEIEITSIEYGNEFPISCNLPDMTIKEFIKSFMQMTASFIQFDDLNRILYFKNISEITNNKINCEDWTSKLSGYSTTYRFPDYAQKNRMNYAEDENVDEDRGNGLLPVNDTTLDFTKDMINLKYAATNQELRLINKDIAKIPVYDLVESVIEKQNDWKDRILLIRFENFALTYDDGVVSSVVINNNLPMANFIYQGAGLDFGSLLEEYYPGLIYILDKVKILKGTFYLTAKDVATLDFFKPVYLQQTGQYYYINKINEFIEGTLTEVELIKL
jgi:hypothetical protein